MNTIYNTKFPYIGMLINGIRESPSIELYGYVFCGTWYKINDKQDELIGITWQNIETGLLISDEQFKKIIFNF